MSRSRSRGRSRSRWKLGRSRHFGLDSRRRKQDVEHESRLILASGDEAGGCEPAGSLLLHERVDAVAPLLERMDRLLGVLIAPGRDDQIDVTGEAWLGPRRDGEAADQGPSETEFGQVEGG